MINAFVNIKTDKKHFKEVTNELLKIKGVSEVHIVTGNFDIIAVLRVSSHEDVAQIVTEHILEIDKILDTNTMMSLKSFSNYNLEKLYEELIK